MAVSNRLIVRPVSKMHCATRRLDIHVWASIWQWFNLDETRAPCVVCHAFLRSFTLVQHVSISEEHLSKLESPYLGPLREPDVRLRLHRVFHFVTKRFRHIRTLRVYFSLYSRANVLKSPYEQGVSDSLARLLASCAPELEELVIYFPNAAPDRAKKLLLGPCGDYAAKNTARTRGEYAAKNTARMEQLYDPVHTIGRHPLRRLCLSIPIPPPMLNRLLGKLKHLQGFVRVHVCTHVCVRMCVCVACTRSTTERTQDSARICKLACCWFTVSWRPNERDGLDRVVPEGMDVLWYYTRTAATLHASLEGQWSQRVCECSWCMWCIYKIMLYVWGKMKSGRDVCQSMKEGKIMVASCLWTSTRFWICLGILEIYSANYLTFALVRAMRTSCWVRVSWVMTRCGGWPIIAHFFKKFPSLTIKILLFLEWSMFAPPNHTHTTPAAHIVCLSYCVVLGLALEDGYEPALNQPYPQARAMSVRYLLQKCAHIREIDVIKTAMNADHLEQLCQASTSLLLLKFSSRGNSDQYILHDVNEAYPRVALYLESWGSVLHLALLVSVPVFVIVFYTVHVPVRFPSNLHSCVYVCVHLCLYLLCVRLCFCRRYLCVCICISVSVCIYLHFSPCVSASRFLRLWLTVSLCPSVSVPVPVWARGCACLCLLVRVFICVDCLVNVNVRCVCVSVCLCFYFDDARHWLEQALNHICITKGNICVNEGCNIGARIARRGE